MFYLIFNLIEQQKYTLIITVTQCFEPPVTFVGTASQNKNKLFN